MLELKANPRGSSRGTIIESQLEQGRGRDRHRACATRHAARSAIISWLVLTTAASRRLINDLGENIKEAGPSIPVKILGLSGAPSPGEEYNVLKVEREAR